MKKTIKLFFCEKMRPRSVVWQSRKKVPSPWKKIFRKKKPSSVFVQIWSSKPCAEIFLNKWVLRYLSFSDLRFRKIVLHNKIINKTRSTKNQENSMHRFGDNYLTNHLVKFLQVRIKPWRVGALRVRTAYHFFLKKIVSEGFLTFFNSSSGAC